MEPQASQSWLQWEGNLNSFPLGFQAVFYSNYPKPLSYVYNHHPSYPREQSCPTPSCWPAWLFKPPWDVLCHFRKEWHLGDADKGKNMSKVEQGKLKLFYPLPSFSFWAVNCVSHPWVPMVRKIFWWVTHSTSFCLEAFHVWSYHMDKILPETQLCPVATS